MKRLTAIFLVLTLCSLQGLHAQPPRVRTSAKKEKTAQKGTVAPRQETKTPAPAFTPSADTWKQHPYMALKTNLAYDVFAVLNLSFECQVHPHWSVELPVIWSLWDWKTTRGLRTVTLQPGTRYWFKTPGSGHAVGADFNLAWYNFRWGDDRYQAAGRPALGASVTYTYSLNLAQRWRMEFMLGVGYVNFRYNTYYNIENGALIDTRIKNYFGPTRFGISLAYTL